MPNLLGSHVVTHGVRIDGMPSLSLDGFAPSDREAVVRHWLMGKVRTSSERSALVYSGSPDDMAHIRQVFADHYHQQAISDATIAEKSRAWGRNFLENLKGHPPFATNVKPLLGRTAVIVGAGPSLDRNGALLPALQARGAAIIASNTSSGPCVARGCLPDAIVSVEARDVSGTLRADNGQALHVLDLTGNPANWEVPARDRWAVCQPQSALVPLLLRLGATPLGYGHNVSCAAAALAIQWGARDVVLVGCDFAYPGGQMYAQGTEWDDMRADPGDGVVEFSGSKLEGGRPRGPQPMVQLDAWGGGSVHSDTTMLPAKGWFDELTKTRPIIDATEGGARIERAAEATLASVLSQMQPMAPLNLLATPPDPCQPDDLLGSLGRVAEYIRDNIADYTTAPPEMPLLHLWMIPAILEMGRHSLRPKAREERLRSALHAACEDVMEIVK